eukprot:jgi/Orpsp1_1/1184915/evm.model.c7180000091520.1
MEIENFDEYINTSHGYNFSPEFEFYGHTWKASFFSYKKLEKDEDQFLIYLKNLNIKDEKEYILTRIIFFFRNIKNTFYMNVFPSSLYCYSKLSSNNCLTSGYEYKINKKDYEECIKPLIFDNKIMFGVYLQIYDNYEIEQYIDKLKNLIKDDNCYKIKEENYFEWEIKDWNGLNKNWLNCSPRFKIGGYKWFISVHPDNNGYVSLELCNINFSNLTNDDDNDDDYIWVNVVFSIRKTTNIRLIDKGHYEIFFDDFTELKDLNVKSKYTDKSIIENNSVVIGAYIRVYDIKK